MRASDGNALAMKFGDQSEVTKVSSPKTMDVIAVVGTKHKGPTLGLKLLLHLL